MGNEQQVTVGLPLDLSQAIDQSIETGEFRSSDQVVLQALRKWKDGRETFGLADDEIGRLWDEGMSSGSGQFTAVEELLSEAERRAKARD